VVPFDQIFAAVKNGAADVGLIIHEGQLTYQNEGLVVCEDLGVWWGTAKRRPAAAAGRQCHPQEI
jgi:1,4-dihydroxy-6-naphthoate synthase